MGRKIGQIGVVAMMLVALGCTPGNVEYHEGRKAELRRDWDSALVDYEKAVRSQPDNPQYLIRETVARTQASLFHLKQGRRLLTEGRSDEAAGEFQKAVGIDPSDQVAAQELAKLLAVQAKAKLARESALKQALTAKGAEEAISPGAVQLKPLPTEHLAHFHMPNLDGHKVFETLAKLANVNVAFTSDFKCGPLSEDLTDITIEDALRLVALQCKAFWRPVTANTILVVPDTTANRRDYDVEQVKAIYLSNPLAAADRTAITNALKTVLKITQVVDNADANCIIVRDSEDKVAAAEQLIHQLDRGKAEILVEVEVLEADRDRIRDLGISPATVSSSGTPTAGLQGGVIFAPTVSTSSGVTVGTSTVINTLGISDFSAVIPSVVASAVLSDSKTRILQNPQIRVTDGQPAKLNIGTSIPIATGSFLPSLGGVANTSAGIGLLASTTFQYKDVGVNLTLTPHLLPNGEIGLHATIEISSLGPTISIGGFSQPTFGQRKIDHDIQLKEGEATLLGGLIERTDTVVVSGVPGLADIPVLKYFFSSQHHEVVDTEVLVLLTPRVVRLPETSLTASGGVAVRGGTRTSAPEAYPTPEIPAELPGRPPIQPPAQPPVQPPTQPAGPPPTQPTGPPPTQPTGPPA
jgi:general secretion pathway protein D